MLCSVDCLPRFRWPPFLFLIFFFFFAVAVSSILMDEGTEEETAARCPSSVLFLSTYI